MLLYSLERSYDASRIVGAEEVPSIESGEVLQSPEDFVTANYSKQVVLATKYIVFQSLRSKARLNSTSSCDESEVVRHGRMINQCVGDHLL